MPNKPTRQEQRGHAQPQQTPAGPRIMSAPVNASAPRGQRIESNLGPGRLYPGVGKLVQRTGLPHRAGTITGWAYGYLDHPNTRDKARTSTRFAGQFMLIDHKGAVIQGAECYLPPTITRACKASLDAQRAGGGGVQGVPISLEVWCEPDQEGRPASPVGYTWQSYDLTPRTETDPLMALAIASGVIERPAGLAIAAPEPQLAEGEEYDPETGEIRPAQPPAAAA